MTPAIAETVQRGMLGAEWVLFEHGSRMIHLEDRERFLQEVASFLERVEGQDISRAHGVE